MRVWPARLDPRRVSSSDTVLSSVSVATLIAFDELEMLKLWKGLYLTMWHSDKPLVQVDLVVCVSLCVCMWGKPLFLLNTGESGREHCKLCAHIPAHRSR